MRDKEIILKEIQRKSIHIMGIVVIPLDFYFGLIIPSILVLILSCLYMLSEHMQKKDKHFPIIQNVTKFALRDKSDGKTDYAPILLAVGVVVSLAIFPTPINYCAIIAVALGDGFASLVGKSFGRHKLIFRKSLEGTSAGFFATFVGCSFFVSPELALGISGIAMSIEILPLGKFDNVVIPLVVGIVLSFIL
ncbi:MAG: hypothetical protein K5798_10490 [Nitrosopumilus sp.]|uniref:diacylglycerol/polyprenol kinase family protein n=1 Tax=Nitrosopumilus sp. TaxID=2024843 RepID=UPI002432B28C|nr:hypothetical protein [Nitrosopumilus sp.]MCV0367673.1 hypothetical protein [Nitrosopumilus sp.]